MMLVGLVVLGAGCTEFSLKNREALESEAHPWIRVDPNEVGFGPAGQADRLTRTVSVSNTGFAPLTVDAIELDGRGSFSLFEWQELPVTLERGASFAFEVVFVPVEAGPLSGEVRIQSDAQNVEDGVVPVRGEGVVPAVELEPEHVAMDEIGVGCVGHGAWSIVNRGFAPALLTRVELSGDDAFSLTSPLELPLSIDPGTSVPLPVSFRSDEDGARGAALEVVSNDPRGRRWGAVSAVAAFGELRRDEFVVPGSAPIDVLFAVDQSCSMIDQANALGTGFSLFIREVAAATSAWQVGVVTNDDACFNYGILSEGTPHYEAVFRNAVHGVEGDDTERLLALADRALGHVNGGCNDGFLDEPAPLHLVFVSDERDQSLEPWSTYWDAYLAHARPGSTVTAHAIADIGSRCGIGNGGDGAGGYLDVAQHSGGEVLDICELGWSSELSRIARTAIAGLWRFPLSAGPVDPGSIVVSVDGAVVRQGWSFDAARGEVLFDVPRSPGQTVEVLYGVLAPCSS